jgi:S1-C subfamily serine protease
LTEVPDTDVRGDDLRVRGAMIVGFASGDSPAASAGLRSGDVVVSVDGKRVADMGHLMRLIGGAIGGTTVKLEVVRDDRTLRIPVRLGSRPDSVDR